MILRRQFKLSNFSAGIKQKKSSLWRRLYNGLYLNSLYHNTVMRRGVQQAGIHKFSGGQLHYTCVLCFPFFDVCRCKWIGNCSFHNIPIFIFGFLYDKSEIFFHIVINYPKLVFTWFEVQFLRDEFTSCLCQFDYCYILVHILSL